jgi:hypothetical protein
LTKTAISVLPSLLKSAVAALIQPFGIFAVRGRLKEPLRYTRDGAPVFRVLGLKEANRSALPSLLKSAVLKRTGTSDEERSLSEESTRRVVEPPPPFKVTVPPKEGLSEFERVTVPVGTAGPSP